MKAKRKSKDILFKLLPIYLVVLLFSTVLFIVLVYKSSTNTVLFSIVSALSSTSLVLIYFFFLLPSATNDEFEALLSDSIFPYISLTKNYKVFDYGYEKSLFMFSPEILQDINKSEKAVFVLNCSEDDRILFKAIFSENSIERFKTTKLSSTFILPNYKDDLLAKYRSTRQDKYLDIKDDIIDYFIKKDTNLKTKNISYYLSNSFLTSDIIMTDNYLVIRYNRLSVTSEHKPKFTIVFNATSPIYKQFDCDLTSFLDSNKEMDISNFQ